MRILLVTDHYPPSIGGAQRWAQLLARGLTQRGHDVTVLTEWNAGQARRETHDGYTVRRARQVRTLHPALATPGQMQSPPFPEPVSIADCARVVNEVRPDVAIAYGWLAWSATGPLHRHGIPVLLSVHDYSNFCAVRTLLRDGEPCAGPSLTKCVPCAGGEYGKTKGAVAALSVRAGRKFLAARVAGVQSISNFVDEITWREMFGHEEPSRPLGRYVIPPFLSDDPVPTAEQQAVIDACLSRLPDAPYIMFAGALRRHKGVDVLLEAYTQLERRPPLVLMGTNHEDTPHRLPEGVTVINDVPHQAVMEAWSRALMAVVPSLWPEPLGYVAVEPASLGVPTIGTYPGGIVDVLGDGAGLLVQRGDTAALADAMQRLIDEPVLRDQLGVAGRKRAQRFQGERVLTEFEQALTEILEMSR